MNKKFDELTKSMAQATTRGGGSKRFSVALAGLALACFGLVSVSRAQTSVLCDPAGDASSSNGKGGPNIPAWLDIVQSEITDTGSDIYFTLTVQDAIPNTPAWKAVDDGGQLWWGWRFVDDLENATIIKDGCVKAAGNLIPAAYFVDVIWDVTSSSFHARLLDDSSCVQDDVPFAFSSNRRRLTVIVSKNLLTNRVITQNPNAFEYFAQTTAWKPNSTGNSGLFHLDVAPNDTNGIAVVGWSASENSVHFCQ